MEETVDTMLTEIVPDDAAQASENQQQERPETPTAEQAPATEPGWIKQRVGKAVAKAVAEAEQRTAAKYEAMLAPIRESVLDREADDLVKAGEFKSLDRAKEYVRLKNGTTPKSEPVVPPKNEQERVDPTVKARADLLAKQAQKIKDSRGLDVMQAFNTDPDVKQHILSGEWDFYDVAEQLSSGHGSPPVPMRTPNGAGVGTVSISGMTDKQFSQLQENLAAGRKYDMRK